LSIFAKISHFYAGAISLDTEAGRHAARYRRALFSILANIASKGLSLILTVISVSLTIPYLGVERFGVWMTISSFVALLSFLDLGIGNALTNRVAQAATKSHAELVRVISGGIIILMALGLIIGIFLVMIASYVQWETLLKIENLNLLPEIKKTGVCFAVLFGMSIFSGGCQRIFAGLQQSYISHIFSSFGFILGCLALLVAARHEAGIEILLFIVFGSQVFASSLLLLVLLWRKQLHVRGSIAFAKNEFFHLYHNGALFFLLQIGGIVGWGADSLIISSSIGVTQVAIYTVVQRLFQMGSQPFMVINTPLWGAYADAEAHGDKSFIRKTLKRSMLLTLGGAGSISLILVVFHAPIISWWTDGFIMTPIYLVILCGVWSVLDACGNAFAMFLNGTNVIRQQLYAVLIFILLALPLKLWLVNEMGMVAIPLATIVAYSISTLMVYGIFCFKDIHGKLFSNS